MQNKSLQNFIDKIRKKHQKKLMRFSDVNIINVNIDTENQENKTVKPHRCIAENPARVTKGNNLERKLVIVRD